MTSTKAEGFEWAFGLNRLSLDFLGVWPRVNSHNWRNVIATPALALVMLLGMAFPQMYALTKVYRQLPLVADNLISLGTCVTATAKIVVLWTGRKEIAELVSQVQHDWLAVKSNSEQLSMRRQARRARLLTASGYCTTLVCVASIVTMPIFDISIRQINNITDPHPKRRMIFQSLYLYDAYESPLYELTYLHQMIAGCLTAAAFCVPDNFFGALVLHACAQCEILEARLERLAATTTTRFVERLRRVVERHVRLIRFVDGVEALFSAMILAHMLFLMLVVGFMGFCVMEAFGRDVTSAPLLPVVTLSATSMDVLLYSLVYCGTAEMLAASSCRLLETTYLPSLHSMPKNRARDLTMIMMRSRKPLKLTAGKVLDLSLNTYLHLVKNAFGYISMLITVNH